MNLRKKSDILWSNQNQKEKTSTGLINQATPHRRLQIANTSRVKPEPDNIVTLNSKFNFRKYQTCISIMHENGPLPTRPCHIINIQDHVPGVSDAWMDTHTSQSIKVISSISKTMYKRCQMNGWTHTHPSSFINHFSTFHLG